LKTAFKRKLFTNFMDRINKLQQYLLVSPTDSFLQHALALEYIKIGNDSEARKLFESILEREPAYVGSYYHLAKLLERTGENELAIQWYEKGMGAAKEVGDKHAYNELQAAYEDLVY
jgi:tetratricopeptide (TPR) repeat protein